MATRVHLVRHAEVHNPEHVVYASLGGYGLSSAGEEQAAAVARYIGRQPVVGVWSSPLERALRTAEPIAHRVGQPVRVETDLTEWALMDRWSGVVWEDLPERFPGELEAFLETPTDLPFSPESLTEMADRIAGVVRHLDETHPHGDLVIVTHQAPIRAGILKLTGTELGSFWDDKPVHTSVTTLRSGLPWQVETVWAPDGA